MKQIIITTIIFLLTNSIFAQEFNCRPNEDLSGGFLEAGHYQYENYVNISNKIVDAGATVIVNAGNYIGITGKDRFIADSKFVEDNGRSVFIAFIKACENYESEVLVACNDILRTEIHEEYAGRKNPNPNQSGVEYSDLTYYPVENMLFMPLDDAITNKPNNTEFVDGADIHAIRAYDLDDATEYAITLTNMPSNFVLFPDADFESLTYMYDNYFALIDEITRELYFLEYDHFNSELSFISSYNIWNETIQYLGSSKFGIEGASYNPHSNSLYIVSEGSDVDNVMIFELDIIGDLSNPKLLQTNRINLTQKLADFGHQNLFTDASGIYHLGNAFSANSENADRFLVLSQESKKILEMDILGNIYGSLMDVSNEFQPEGIAIIPINNTPQIVVSSEGQKLDANDNEAAITAKISQYVNGCVDNGSPKLSQQASNQTTISISPNPVVGETAVSYQLANAAEVSVYVTDVLGKKLATLVEGTQQQAGLNEVMFDASNLPTGVYFCTVNANNKVSTQKLIKAN